MTSYVPSSAGIPTSGSSTPRTTSASAKIASPETLDLSSGWELVHKGRDNKRLKAMRLLVTGRLRVLRVDAEFIAAECRGDSGEVYNLGWRDQRWTCSCPARVDCSHINALWAVVAVQK
jgi:hypothetical protein